MARASDVKCPMCKEAVAMRVNRNGFLQRSVLVYLGFYPWKCGACGSVFMYRKRGIRPRMQRPTDVGGEQGGVQG